MCLNSLYTNLFSVQAFQPVIIQVELQTHFKGTLKSLFFSLSKTLRTHCTSMWVWAKRGTLTGPDYRNVFILFSQSEKKETLGGSVEQVEFVYRSGCRRITAALNRGRWKEWGMKRSPAFFFSVSSFHSSPTPAISLLVYSITLCPLSLSYSFFNTPPHSNSHSILAFPPVSVSSPVPLSHTHTHTHTHAYTPTQMFVGPRLGWCGREHNCLSGPHTPGLSSRNRTLSKRGGSKEREERDGARD